MCANRAWNQELDCAMKNNINFKQSIYKPCVYFWRFFIDNIFVDDRSKKCI